MSSAIRNQRGAWLLGLWTGGHVTGAWITHSWSLLLIGAVGLYGLVDVDALNRRLERKR